MSRKKEAYCAGCGITSTSIAEGSLCWRCREALKVGRKVLEEDEKSKSGWGYYRLNYPHMTPLDYRGSLLSHVNVETKDYGFGGPNTSHEIDKQDVGELLHELAGLCSDPQWSGRAHYHGKLGSWMHYGLFTGLSGKGEKEVRLRFKVAYALQRLEQAVRETSQAYYDEGYRHGSDLLKAMVEGRLSIDEMNRLALGIDVSE